MTTLAPSNLSQLAKERFIEKEGKPFLRCIWTNTVFIHYEVDADVLQKYVPFPLELYAGRAYVSLVAFTLSQLRPGFVASPAIPFFPSHHFLNVRTYVRHGDEAGIFFLVEWLTSRLCVRFAPPVYGLPYRLGRHNYRHQLAGPLKGRVDAQGTLRYKAATPASPSFATSSPGTLEEFLIERYSAFTYRNSVRRRFRVWHPAWRQTPIDLNVLDDSLIAGLGPWFESARFIGANYSPGLPEVWISRPYRIS